MKPTITSGVILSILSTQWLNINEIVTIMGIEDPLDRRFLLLKLKDLSHKGKIEYVYHMNEKFWRSITTRLKEIEHREFNDAENNRSPRELNFEMEEKLSFCSECGALMLPSEANGTKIMKCKCGATKPFEEHQAHMYVLKSKIKHNFNEDTVFHCVCGKKYESQVAFLDHSRTCKECRKYIVPKRSRVVYRTNEQIDLDLIEWEKKKNLDYQEWVKKEEEKDRERNKIAITEEKDRKWDEKVKINERAKIPFYCVFCGMEFLTKSTLDIHSSNLQVLFSARNSEVKFWFQKGAAFFKLKEFEKAYDCFKRVLSIDPSICVAQYYLKVLK